MVDQAAPRPGFRKPQVPASASTRTLTRKPPVLVDPYLAERIQSRSLIPRDMYKMMIKQQPRDGQVLTAQKRASAKKPQNERISLDPPAVVELAVLDDDPSRCWLHSPYLFCTAELVRLDDKPNRSDTLSGTLTSSLHVVKMNDGKAHGFFVFSDLVPLCAGMFFLRFTLFEMRKSPDGLFAEMLNSVSSVTLEVHARNKFAPLAKSTDLTRALSEGGVKVRVRKEPTRRLQRNKTSWGFQRYMAGYGQVVPAAVYGQPQLYPHHGQYHEHWSQNGNAAYNTNNAIDIRDRLSVQHHGMAPPWHGGAHQQAALAMAPPMLPQQLFPQPLHRLQHGAFLQDVQKQSVSQPLPLMQHTALLHETQHSLMPPPPSQSQQQQPSFPPLEQILPQHFIPLPPANYTVRDDTNQLGFSTGAENELFFATTSASSMPHFTAADEQVSYTTSSAAQMMYVTALEDQMIRRTSPGTDSAYTSSSSGLDQQQYLQSAGHVSGTYDVSSFNPLQDPYDPNSSHGGFQ